MFFLIQPQRDFRIDPEIFHLFETFFETFLRVTHRPTFSFKMRLNYLITVRLMASNFKAQPREVKWVLSELNPQNKSAGNQVNPRLQHTTTTTQKVSAPISSELLRPLTSPLPSQESLSSGHYGVSRQHLEGGRLSGSVHTEEAETLRTHILKSPFTG